MSWYSQHSPACVRNAMKFMKKALVRYEQFSIGNRTGVGHHFTNGGRMPLISSSRLYSALALSTVALIASPRLQPNSTRGSTAPVLTCPHNVGTLAYQAPVRDSTARDYTAIYTVCF